MNTKFANRPVLPIITAIFFVLTFLIKALVDDAFIRGDVSATVAYTKYATAAAACFAGLTYAFKHGERLFVNEFNKLLVILGVFTVVTVVMQIVTVHFSVSTYVDLFKLGMPMILAYAILNALPSSSFYRCMVAVLLVSMVGYALTLAHEGTSFSAIFDSNYETSTSATESSSFSGIFLVLTFYFAFFRRRKLWLILSAVFCILTFKRLAILAAFLALAASFFAPKLMSRRLPRWTINVFKIGTVAGVAMWTWLLLPGQENLFINLFGKTQQQFTLGRNEVLNYLLNSGYVSYGFGSASEVTHAAFGVSFEMDLTKIAFELTPLVMVLFIWLYWDVAGDSLWGVVIIGYFMVNLITSDSLSSNFCLTLAYCTCGLVTEASKGGGCADESRQLDNLG